MKGVKIHMAKKHREIDMAQEILAKKKRMLRNERIRDSLAANLMSTTKQLVWLFSINGILWIWCSYVLAFMDKVQIAESLSSNVCTVVLGQLGMYLITKTVENVFRYNDFGGKSLYTYDNQNVEVNNTFTESEVVEDGTEADQYCSGGDQVDPGSLV